MEALKCKCSALAGAVPRIFNRHHRSLDDDPETLDVEHLERQIESVKNSDTSYLAVHEDIAELHTEDSVQDEELDILEQHEEAVSKTLSLLNWLISIKMLHLASTDLEAQITNLE